MPLAFSVALPSSLYSFRNNFLNVSSLYNSITSTNNFSCKSGNFENSILSPIFTCCLFSSYNLISTVFVPFFILSKGLSFNFILCIIFFLLYLILKSIVHYFLPHFFLVYFLGLLVLFAFFA